MSPVSRDELASQVVQAVDHYFSVFAETARPGAPRGPLALLFAPRSESSPRETFVARGMGVFEELDGRFRVTGTYSRAEIADLQLTGDGSLATVKARVLIGLELEDAQGEPVDSSNVVTHDLLLCRSRADWLIVSDDYLDPATPKYLRLAGAPAWMVREARVALRQAGYVRPPNAAVETVRRYLTLLDRRRVSEAGRLLVPSLGGRRLEFGVAHVKFLSAGLEGPLRDGTLTLGVDFLVTDSVPPCDWENGRHQLSFELVRDEGSGVWRIAGWHAG